MASQTAATVETLLGVNANAGNTRLSLANSIMSGLPVSALDRLAGAVAPDDARFKFRLIPKATLERRRKSATGWHGWRRSISLRSIFTATAITPASFSTGPTRCSTANCRSTLRWKPAPVPMRLSTCLGALPIAVACDCA
jgi:hypothetical protein